MFPIEAQSKADEMFGSGKFAPGYERTYWDGCTHGFAVRGDLVGLTSNGLPLARVLIGIFPEKPSSQGGQRGRVQGQRRILDQVLVIRDTVLLPEHVREVEKLCKYVCTMNIRMIYPESSRNGHPRFNLLIMLPPAG